ncbi:MAG: paiB [Planctomycetaceae bacterium]|nr:paiB [Planctomycetaceae bacterium]
MYVPSSFAETDREKLHDFVEQHSFGLLVTHRKETSLASHLPFLLDRQAGPQGTLIGHLARANSQWEGDDQAEVLTIFSGPHAYISPTWYAEELVVPTWNYIAVHVYGRVTWIHNPTELLEIVKDSVQFYEQSLPQPWQLDAPAEFIEKLLKQIVGFRIEITRMEGKWKLNQNHPAERRERVIQALSQRSDDNSQGIAAAMIARR